MDLHGGGISIRSFIHINDVADATFKLALNANPGSSWHLSTNESISIKDLVKKIFKLVGSDFDNIVKIGDERLGKDQSYLLDSQSIREEFSWKDKISIEKGLDETFLWIKDNLSILRNLSWNYNHKK